MRIIKAIEVVTTQEIKYVNYHVVRLPRQSLMEDLLAVPRIIGLKFSCATL